MSYEDFWVKFLKKEHLAENTFRFTFERPFDFLPGQYTTMFFDTDSRDFTIASSPLEKSFTIITKSGITQFKEKLFNLSVGSMVQVKHPTGGFILKDMDSPKVFIAGGIGITPFCSMITTFHINRFTIPITLFAFFSKRSEIILYNELNKIATKNKNFKIIYSLSQDEWNGEKGRISENLIKKYVSNIKLPEFLIAGGEEMTYDTEELLLRMGINSSKIRLDIFTGY